MAITSMSAKSFNEIIFNLQMQMKIKGQNCIKALIRNFSEADRDGSGFLDREEFEELLSASNIFLAQVDITRLMRHFDKNQDGRISFAEFYETLVPPLSEKRSSIVQEAYDKLESLGPVTMDLLYANFSPKSHPDVVNGSKHEDEITAKFLDVFDARNRSVEAVSREEFLERYTQISASYPHDDVAFVRMVKALWALPSDNDAAAANVEDLEVMLKDKVRLRLHGNESEESALLKVFKFIDIDENGTLSPNEFREALSRIGMHLSDEQLKGFYLKYDLDRSGTLDYGEFCRALSGLSNHIFSKSISHSFYSK